MHDKPLISLKNITKSFTQAEQTIEVLHSINLDVAPGEFVALQGTSGSGKTTLLNLIGLLDRPTSGTYLLQDRDVSSIDDDEQSELRNLLIGFVFQYFHLIPYLSAYENILLPGQYNSTPRSALKERAKDLLGLVGLGDRAHFKPSQLSGGQQQRVALARAMLNDPQLILADEPTGQLDSKTSTEIMNLLDTVHSRGKTIILVTHDEETASHAKRRITVTDGIITA